MVERPGEAEPLTAQLTLPGDPVRLGFSWDQDRAASSMVMLTRIVPGSAAAQAGLAIRDRVYQVDRREFADGPEFGRLVTRPPGRSVCWSNARVCCTQSPCGPWRLPPPKNLPPTCGMSRRRSTTIQGMSYHHGIGTTASRSG